MLSRKKSVECWKIYGNIKKQANESVIVRISQRIEIRWTLLAQRDRRKLIKDISGAELNSDQRVSLFGNFWSVCYNFSAFSRIFGTSKVNLEVVLCTITINFGRNFMQLVKIGLSGRYFELAKDLYFWPK